ncbi:exported protein of unknown function [Pararobbsia alpina]|uniref:hypothetical protein n=1 Tax=Pararobbsia alpina TaxID=621374 RepID=UPI0039A6571E
MVRFKGLIVVFLCALLSSRSASAQTAPSSLDVGYSNGMDNSLVEAVDSLFELLADLHSQPQWTNAGANLVLLYHVGAFAKNLEEVYLQKRDEKRSNVDYKAMSSTYFSILASHADTHDANVAQFLKLACDPSVALTTEAIKSMSAEETVREQTKNDASALSDGIFSGRHLLLASHSQGNLYTNLAIAELQNRKIPKEHLPVLHVVGLAVPASYVARLNEPSVHANYITWSNDYVINGLRLLVDLMGVLHVKTLDPPLPSDVSEPATSGDWRNHAFIEAYIKQGPLNRQFLQLADCVVRSSGASCSPTSTPATVDDSQVRITSRYACAAPATGSVNTTATFPGPDLARLTNKYPPEVQASADRFARNLWDFWVKGSSTNTYQSVAGLEYAVIESEAHLVTLMQANHIENRSGLLAGIEATLAQTPDIFAAYVHTDGLVSGHPWPLQVAKLGISFPTSVSEATRKE